MIHKFAISGITCASCIQKINALLTSKINATNINFSVNNTIIEFNTTTIVDIKQMNQLLKKIGNYSLDLIDATSSSESSEDNSSYKPIYLIFIYLILVNCIISFRNMELTNFMPDFMAGFFLVFSFFKLLDIKGFADGYSFYDIIAKKFYYYGYVYPFIELGFGFGYLIIPHSLYFNSAVFLLMLISSVGVIKAKLSKQQFYCACVGTFLKVPLGSIAIIEDLLMTFMSLIMILKLLSII